MLEGIGRVVVGFAIAAACTTIFPLINGACAVLGMEAVRLAFPGTIDGLLDYLGWPLKPWQFGLSLGFLSGYFLRYKPHQKVAKE